MPDTSIHIDIPRRTVELEIALTADDTDQEPDAYPHEPQDE